MFHVLVGQLDHAVVASPELSQVPDDGDCHEDCWRVPRARMAIHRFLDRKLSHDGDRFYVEKHGTKSPFGG